MSIRVDGVGVTDEEQVVIDDSSDDNRIVIHPWDRTNQPGWTLANDGRAVFIALGSLTKHGYEKRKKKDEPNYVNGIFDRDDFIEGILAVFPELTRAK